MAAGNKMKGVFIDTYSTGRGKGLENFRPDRIQAGQRRKVKVLQSGKTPQVQGRRPGRIQARPREIIERTG